MRSMTMKRTLLATVALTSVLAACQNSQSLETRTFTLEHIDAYEASVLLEPYVYVNRAGAPGAMTNSQRGITVRETSDNLEQIARVLADIDVPRPDVRLHFQLIHANGFTDTDPRIAEVETQLRELFQFRGYQLIGEAFVSATDRSEIEQGLGGDHEVSASIYYASPGTIRLNNVHLYSYEGGDRLTTTVNIRPGQTLILGSASKAGEDVTLLLTVRAERVDA
jgi:hypothetical protein